VRKSLEFLVGILHLVVLGIENNRLLDLFNVSLENCVVTDAQFLYAEIRFECISDSISALLSNIAIEHLNLY